MSQHLFFHGNEDVTVLLDTFTDDDPRDIELEEVRVHLSAAGGANSLTIAIDNPEHPECNTVLKSQDMTAITDLMYQPTKPHVLRATDNLKFAWTNASHREWGMEVIYRRKLD